MRITVNGIEYTVDVPPETSLATVLRDHLGLIGTKIGCGDGQCGACTALLDNRPIRSCVFPVRRVSGKQVTTIEGLAATWGEPGQLHPIQRAFIDHGAVQCGFCTPGLIMAAASLWAKMADPEEQLDPITDGVIKHVFGRNACRCTGYAGIIRAMRSAVHEFETGRPLAPAAIERMEPLRVVGHSPPQPDAVAKVTGAAKYADDYRFGGMLYGATLRAAHPHARILSIDTSHALALPGVHAVLTHRDVPGRNLHGLVTADWPVLCGDKVRYLGDAVAIVAAETREAADQALDLIEVAYEPLPVVPTAEAAREPHAALVHPEWETGNLLEHIKVRHHDVQQGLAEADVVVEREYRTPIYEHMFMEPECSIAVPAGYDEDHPKLTVYTGSQIPYADRDQIAAALDLEPDQVRVKGTLIGGGFGGKEDIAGQIHAALLAQATGRPVKILYTREESMLVHPKRHATVIRIKTAAKRDGKLTAIEAELVGDAGAYASLSTKVLTRATTHATGPYQVPHARIDCYAMYTNNPPAGAFRGFGVTQSAFAVEQNMDILARELGIDPIELRRRNALRVGSITATGQELQESVGLLACLEWIERRMAELPAPPQQPDLRYGWGVAAAFKNTGLGGGAADAAGAEVLVYVDGTAEVRSSSADMGQGLTTVVAQAVAEELGLSYGRVRVLLSDTDLSPDGGPTTASRQTFVTGNAARLAARSMRLRMAAVAGRRWANPIRAITFRDDHLLCSGQSIPFSQAVAWLEEEGVDSRLQVVYQAPETRPLGKGGDMHFAYSFGAQAAQVAVDTRNGKVTVLRLLAADDAGRAINPQALVGQVEGSLVMSLGTTLTEEYVIHDGIPATRRWLDYRVPLIGQMPEMEVHLVEELSAEGPYGAKGIGELPSIPTPAAICNAIYDAVGVRPLQIPVTAAWLKAEMERLGISASDS
jgi:CO/xanthine dehydrogenase Mo-binding subunit/aerobic-type carbon monoxide dehydrogenase small subunit (CoxS/CutS family)